MFTILPNDAIVTDCERISKCRLYASVNWVITGSGNGLSPVRHQAITWNIAGVLPIGL